MPKRNDIEKVLILGSGPIIIGQGSEYDYFINQSIKAFKELNIETVVVNSNPTSISTDATNADITYIEPLDIKHIAAIIELENPTAILPTLGGQKALNLCSELSKSGILEKYDVKVIGVSINNIELTENRIAFKKLMQEHDLSMAKSASASTVEEAIGIAKYLSYPVVIRPAFTTGGFGGGLVYNIEELSDISNRGIGASLSRSILIEEAVLGWKELEVEALRDSSGKIIIAGMLENVDPMGVHTGDSLSVMPILTLSKNTLMKIREASLKIVSALSIIGSINIQFAYNGKTDQLIVVEANLRATRTSALISKSVGLSIAEVATKLAMGINLNEIKRDKSGLPIEDYVPTTDNVVIKMPCWSMEKFKGSVDKLGTQMKSVGEIMSIGGSFKEAFNKAFKSLENHHNLNDKSTQSLDAIYSLLRCPSSERYYNIYQALMKDGTIDIISELTGIDKFFIREIGDLIRLESELKSSGSLTSGMRVEESLLKQAKLNGFSDRSIAEIKGVSEQVIRDYRTSHNIIPTFNRIPNSEVYFETYKTKLPNEPVSSNKKIIILGSGPNRIGQGNEFDYCTVHSANAVKALGYEAIIINSNPAAVSTDYTLFNRVYIEPMTIEDILAIINRENPVGVLTAFGGQTPYSLVGELIAAGVKVIGADKDMITLTESRLEFKKLLDTLGISMTNSGVAKSNEEAQIIATSIGYPIIARPPYIIGGRGMEIIHESEGLRRYMLKAKKGESITIDKFLTDAVEVEVDALCVGKEVFIPEYMEHIEYAGIHSGDSDCVIPVSNKIDIKLLNESTRKVALALKVKGLINIKYAISDSRIFLLEARIRSSRSVPLMSKVVNINLSSIATDIMILDTEKGEKKLRELKLKKLPYFGVKAAVFPFNMFREVDPLLGPEMRSTGSVLGLSKSVGEAFNKAQAATDTPIPTSGSIIMSVDDSRKKALEPVAAEFIKLGFKILATSGTYNHLKNKGINVTKIDKMYEGRPNIADAMINSEVDLLVNTPSGIKSEYDDSFIRKIAIKHHICYITTIEAANAAINGIKEIKSGKVTVKSLQSYYN